MPKTVPVSTNGDKPTTDPVWLTPQQAADYTGRKKNAIAKALDKYPAIFITDETVKYTAFPGYPTIVQIDRNALDQWLDAIAKNPSKPRAPRNERGRLEQIRVKDEQRDQVIVALAELGLAFEPKATRSKKAQSTGADTTAEPAPIFEHELVEA